MKKHLFVIAVVLSMLFAFVGTAGASPKADGVTLLRAVSGPGGAVFTFRVDGSLSGWRGSVSWDGGSVQMTCGNLDGDILTCSAPRTAVGKNIIVAFQGATFRTYVKPYVFCYSVWDYDPDGVWHDYGPHCQDEPAQYGDWTNHYNPDWGDSYPYLFWYQDESCLTGISGDAYYWIFNCGP